LTHCGAPTAAAVKDRNLKAAKTNQLGKLSFIIALWPRHNKRRRLSATASAVSAGVARISADRRSDSSGRRE